MYFDICRYEWLTQRRKKKDIRLWYFYVHKTQDDLIIKITCCTHELGTSKMFLSLQNCGIA